MARHGVGWMLGRWIQLLTIGALALAPLGLTLWILWLLVQLFSFVGGLIARPVLGWLAQSAPPVEALLERPMAEPLLELAFALALLTIAGLLAGNFVGRVFGEWVSRVVAKIPIASVVYASARQLIESFQSPEAAAKKVVLIEFPSEHMKAVGLVTREFRDTITGEHLVAVYVPTTPNPTSGYVEIVPAHRLVWLDWTTAEAIQFIVSAGVTAPDRITFHTAAPAPSSGVAVNQDRQE
ncbi:MAG: DUF502 domain-containing protein [Hyphomonadaceae bacterium]|nr:DUF502 domain-containing protein [Hyphomonadaceae bacterium]MBX3510874.1 DUF502 domain-containing protein [Hyphomonadaceae bacterium]